MSRKRDVDTETPAQDQIRAFVERIMRMREEARAINDDIREIYAEAKGNGFDKTVLGKIVLYVENRGKDANAVAEKDALFDLYLGAFDGDASRTHAHEADDDDTDSADPEPTGGPVDGAEPETSLAPVSSTIQPSGGKPVGALPSAVEFSDVTKPEAGGLIAAAHGTKDIAPIHQSTAPRTDVGDNSTEEPGHGQPLDPAAAITLPASESPPVDTIRPRALTVTTAGGISIEQRGTIQ